MKFDELYESIMANEAGAASRFRRDMVKWRHQQNKGLLKKYLVPRIKKGIHHLARDTDKARGFEQAGTTTARGPGKVKSPPPNLRGGGFTKTPQEDLRGLDFMLTARKPRKFKGNKESSN